MSDTPIFDGLLSGYSRAGRIRLPWVVKNVVSTINIRVDPEETQNSIENQMRLARILNQRIKRGYW